MYIYTIYTMYIYATCKYNYIINMYIIYIKYINKYTNISKYTCIIYHMYEC